MVVAWCSRHLCHAHTNVLDTLVPWYSVGVLKVRPHNRIENHSQLSELSELPQRLCNVLVVEAEVTC